MLKNRPAAFLCLVFSAGIAAGLFLSFEKIALLIIIIASAIIVLARKNKSFAKLVLITAVALVLGFSYAKIYVPCFSPATPEAEKTYTFIAAVRDTDENSDYTCIEAEVQDEASPFDGSRFSMFIHGSSPRAGTVVSVKGTVSVANNKYKAKGVDYVVDGDYTVLSDVEPQGFYFKILGIRNWVGDVIDRAYSGNSAGFYKALLIGDRNGLTIEFEGAFSRSGLSHIMAISGQHFSLIIFNAYLVLLTILRRKKLCSVIAIVLAVAYTVFTGASPSIIRACFMCSVVFAASVFDEESDGIINLSLALIVLLIANPYSIINTSLQLSFLATGGIIYTNYHISLYFERHGTSKGVIALITPLAFSVAASLFCTPIFLTSFDYVSLLAPLSNILVNWLVSLAMIWGILFIIPALIIKEVAIIPSLIYHAIKAIALWVSELKVACVSTELPYIRLLLIPSLFTMLAFSAFKPKRAVTILCVVFASTLIISFGCSEVQQAKLEKDALLYVKDGTASTHAFYADESITAIIDCNGSNGVSATVTQNGYTYIDAYVVTACTENTVTRLRRTLPYTPVDTVYVPWEENDYTEETLSFVKSKGLRIVRYKNQALSLGYMTVYTPTNDMAVGGYIIKAEKNGSKLSVMNPSVWVNCDEIDRRDTLVITKAGMKGRIDYSLFPYTYDKLIVSYDEDFCAYLKDNGVARAIDTYEENLLLYFGKNGVVKE